MRIPVPVQVLGGADLFLQGLIVPSFGLGELVAGEVRTISIPGNRYPFAGAQMQPAHVASPCCSQAGWTGMPAYVALSSRCMAREGRPPGCQSAQGGIVPQQGWPVLTLPQMLLLQHVWGLLTHAQQGHVYEKIASERQCKCPTEQPPLSDAADFTADIWPAAMGPGQPA